MCLSRHVADLTLQVGIATGPVTGGFLKGPGARFQIFGDTVNTARLIQASGMSNRIHLSQAAADLLIKANKRNWVTEREDRVYTSEKGELKTFWLVEGLHHEHFTRDGHSCHGSVDDSDIDEATRLDGEERWVEYIVETFKTLLKQIIARRQRISGALGSNEHAIRRSLSASYHSEKPTMPLEEVKECIELPQFDRRAAKKMLEVGNMEVPKAVVEQLRAYVSEISSLYNDNPFHVRIDCCDGDRMRCLGSLTVCTFLMYYTTQNFAHASYVVMAITKYMNRVKNASEINLPTGEDRFRTSVQAAIHSHTFGITSCPLTQFACVFSALIHDVGKLAVEVPLRLSSEAMLAFETNVLQHRYDRPSWCSKPSTHQRESRGR